MRFLCKSTRTACLAASGGAWATLAAAQLSFTRVGMDAAASSALSDAGFAQLSAVLGAFSIGGSLSLCIPVSGGAAAGIRTVLPGQALSYVDSVSRSLLAAGGTSFTGGPRAVLVVNPGSVYTSLSQPPLGVVELGLVLSCIVPLSSVLSSAASIVGRPTSSVTLITPGLYPSPQCGSGRQLQAGGAGTQAVTLRVAVDSSLSPGAVLATLGSSAAAAISLATGMTAVAPSMPTSIDAATQASVSASGAAAQSSGMQVVDASPLFAAANGRPLTGPDDSVLQASSLTDGSATFRSDTSSSRDSAASIGKVSVTAALYIRFKAYLSQLGIPVWAAGLLAVVSLALLVTAVVVLVRRRKAAVIVKLTSTITVAPSSPRSKALASSSKRFNVSQLLGPQEVFSGMNPMARGDVLPQRLLGAAASRPASSARPLPVHSQVRALLASPPAAAPLAAESARKARGLGRKVSHARVRADYEPVRATGR